jgi:hypothetical protein
VAGGQYAGPPPGPGKAARNEQRKLLATWLNTLAGATVTVGVLAPAAGILYGFSIPGADRAPWLLAILPVGWFSFGVALHLAARRIAGA